MGGDSAIICYIMSELVYSCLWYHTMCVVERYVHICLSYAYTMCNIVQDVVSIVIVFRFINLL